MKKLIVALFIIFPITTFAAPKDIAKINAQIAAEKATAEKLKTKVQASDREISRTQKDLVKATSKLSELDDDKAALDSKMSELKKRDLKLRGIISENSKDLSIAAAALLQISSSPTPEANPTEAVKTSIVLAALADNFDAELKETEQAVEDLEDTKRDIEKQQKKLNTAAEKLSAQKAELDKLMQQRKSQNAKLKEQSAAIEARLKKLAASAKSLSDLSNKVQDEPTVAQKKKKKVRAPKGGGMKPPVRGMIVRGFGDKSSLGLTSTGWYIRTYSSEPVIAPGDARVEFADSFKGLNKVLILNHQNGYYTVLANLMSLDVIAGQEVLAGEPVGAMGSGSPELFLEFRFKKTATDPEEFFNKPKGRGILW